MPGRRLAVAAKGLSVVIRRKCLAAAVLAAAFAAAAILGACGGDFEFRPSGQGRGQGVNYNQAPSGSLYEEGTPTPAP